MISLYLAEVRFPLPSFKDSAPTHWENAQQIRGAVPSALVPRFDHSRMLQYAGAFDNAGVLYVWTPESSSVRLLHESHTRASVQDFPDPLLILERRLRDIFPDVRPEQDISRTDGVRFIDEFYLLRRRAEELADPLRRYRERRDALRRRF